MTMGPDASALRGSAVARDLWAAAAVRERFRLGDLLDDWLKTQGETGPEDERAALRVAMDIQDHAHTAYADDGRPALRLPMPVRHDVLRNIGAAGARKSLDAIPVGERALVEDLFHALLRDGKASVDLNDRDQVVALGIAAQNAAATGKRIRIDQAELRAERRRLDLLSSLGGPDLRRFVGRDADLERLRRLWKSGAERVVVEGLGGMGKSLLVSKLVSELLETADHHLMVFHLDFDRRDLQGANHSAIFSLLPEELTRQAKNWVDPLKVDALLRDAAQEDIFQGTEAHGSSRSGRALSSRAERLTGLAELLYRETHQNPAWLNWLGAKRRSVIIIADSLEQVLGFSDVAIPALNIVTETMRSAGLSPFLILVARSFKGVSEFDLGDQRIDLGQFSDEEASSYLANEAARLGVLLDPAMAERATAVVGRSPLALRLAVSLIEKDPGAFEAAQWAKDLLDNPERIQASLYDRILCRFKNEKLVKIARPGLLVRRLSEAVIEIVLAKPCGLELVAGEAEELLWQARSQGQLFTSNPADPAPDALWHRADLRTLMLPDLDVTVPEAVANEINAKAVEYYAQRDDPISRTEELYHRLRLGQGADQLDPRWTGQAGAALKAALAELPPHARAYVRRRLGTASLSGGVDAVGGEQAPAELRQVVQDELERLSDGADPLSTLARFGADRMEGPVADLYAETLLSTGRLDALFTEAAQLLASRRAPPSVIAAVSNTAGAALEGLGRLDDALEYYQTGIEAAPLDSGDSIVIAIAARVGALRVARKLSETRRFANENAVRRLRIDETLGLAEPIWSSLLARQSVASREFVAELSDPQTERDSNRLLLRLLDNLVRSGQAFPSAIDNGARAAAIAGRLGLVADSLSVLARQATKFAFGSVEEQMRLIEIIREEVDWTLASASRRRSN